MKRYEGLLFAGFILISFGLLVISLGSDQTDSFFVIFPFIFIGNASPLLIAATLLFLLFGILLSFKWIRHTSRQSIEPIHFVAVKSRCSICAGLIPENAEYCPSCGNLVEGQDGK